jgi:hypothetical protein
MATREASVELKALKAKVDDWRRQRGKRTRIPDELWAEAVKVAKIDGVWATSRATRFQYPELKKKLAVPPRVPVTALMGKVAEPPCGDRAKAFVELSMNALGGGTTTVVELVGRGGYRMKVEAAGGMDLAGLVQAFFGGNGR